MYNCFACDFSVFDSKLLLDYSKDICDDCLWDLDSRDVTKRFL